MVLVQSWPPHLALAPIAQVDPPLMPFRDAGYSQADYGLTVQDVVYGLWRAKNCGILEMHSFNLEEYEKHELVENGDLNSVGDNFVAFASPVTGHNSIKPVLKYFKKHNVQLVVRLNSPLYDSKIFEKEGIQHIDLIFDDYHIESRKTKLLNQAFDPDVIGDAQHYCIPCAKYFMDQKSLTDHTRAKAHKARYNFKVVYHLPREISAKFRVGRKKLATS